MGTKEIYGTYCFVYNLGIITRKINSMYSYKYLIICVPTFAGFHTGFFVNCIKQNTIDISIDSWLGDLWFHSRYIKTVRLSS